MKGREPATRFCNFRGDTEDLDDVRVTVQKIRELLPKASKMYLDVPERARSIDVIRAALHLYLESLSCAIAEIESQPKRSLNLWAERKG